MYSTNAGLPFTVALTPSSCVGMRPLTKSDPCHERASGDKFVPLISTHVFWATADAPPATLTTDIIWGVMAAGAAGVALTELVTQANPERKRLRFPTPDEYCNSESLK